MIKLIDYTAILFDFDGTLVDSWPGVRNAYIEGYQFFNPGESAQHIDALQNDNREYQEAIKYVFNTSIRNENYEKKVAEIYLRDLAKNVQAFSEVEQVLTHLNTIKKPWGIVTTKEHAFVNEIIKDLSFLKTDYLVCGDHVTNKKPDPEGLLKAVQYFDLPADKKILYVGDLESDIIAAKSAGFSSACALYGYCDEEEARRSWQADFYLNNITDLITS